MMCSLAKTLTTSRMIAKSQNLMSAARPRYGSGEKAREVAVSSMNKSSGAAIGGNQSRRRVMSHSAAKARMAQAKNIDATAMLTSGIVTPSIVKQRAARRSLIARDCMQEVIPNCDGLTGGRAPYGGFNFRAERL